MTFTSFNETFFKHSHQFFRFVFLLTATSCWMHTRSRKNSQIHNLYCTQSNVGCCFVVVFFSSSERENCRSKRKSNNHSVEGQIQSLSVHKFFISLLAATHEYQTINFNAIILRASPSHCWIFFIYMIGAKTIVSMKKNSPFFLFLSTNRQIINILVVEVVTNKKQIYRNFYWFGMWNCNMFVEFSHFTNTFEEKEYFIELNMSLNGV